MIGTSERKKLDSTMEKIRAASFSEKQNEKSEEELIDSFLDAINKFKKDLIKRTNNINDISERIEELTWLKNVDQPTLQKLNELIVLAKDCHQSLIRNYVGFNVFRKKSIATKEITEFKQALDFLKESYSDIEGAFFIFSKQAEFISITTELEELA